LLPIHLVSGAIILAILIRWNGNNKVSEGSWYSGMALVIYATFFSFAYVMINTGMGALILFGTVQISLIGWSIYQGDYPGTMEYLGLVCAFSGLVYLTLPGIGAPNPVAVCFMIISGLGWTIYTILGKGVDNPVMATADNFIYSVPLVLIVGVMNILFSDSVITATGILLAIASGAFASALGYCIWYTILPEIGLTLAAILQLTVPVLAALSGILLLGENITLRLILSTIIVLTGVAIAIIYNHQRHLVKVEK
jgi:drug/metabolite transporter (DMT)-like permease